MKEALLVILRRQYRYQFEYKRLYQRILLDKVRPLNGELRVSTKFNLVKPGLL